jgi:hypothetical protein
LAISQSGPSLATPLGGSMAAISPMSRFHTVHAVAPSIRPSSSAPRRSSRPRPSGCRRGTGSAACLSDRGSPDSVGSRGDFGCPRP